MPPEHDDLIAQLRIAAGDLSHHVETLHVVGESGRKAERELDRDLLVEHPHHAPVMLAREDERGERRVPLLIVLTGYADVLADRAGGNDRGDPFRREELQGLDLLLELLVEVVLFFLQ
jgi:hypothetical protein